MSARAAVYVGPNVPLEIYNFPLPKVEPNSLLLKVKMACVCGSDLHLWNGKRPELNPPRILGHEAMGEVYEMGEKVTTDSLGNAIDVGDRVVYEYIIFCGRCYYCLMKREPTLCLNWKGLGTMSSEEPPFLNGGFAEYVYLRPENSFFKVPEELPNETVAPINCALSSMINGIEKVGLNFRDRVVVQGAGALGQYSVVLAREMGASTIIVIDGVKERLRIAEDFGADYTINLTEFESVDSRVKEVMKITNGFGADLCIEVAGTPEAVPEGLQMLRRGGRYLEMGTIFSGAISPIDISWIILRGLRIVGARNYEPRHLAKALDFIEKNKDKYSFERLITKSYTLNEINEAFKTASERSHLRVAVIP